MNTSEWIMCYFDYPMYLYVLEVINSTTCSVSICEIRPIRKLDNATRL